AQIMSARLAAAAPSAAAPATHELAEKIVENVGHGRAAKAAMRAARSKAATAHAAVKSGMAELVIGRPALLVLQRVIGLVEFLETLLGSRVALVLVGMVFLGESPISLFQLIGGCVAAHAEHVIKIALRHGISPCSRRGRGGRALARPSRLAMCESGGHDDGPDQAGLS